ncbi:MAG: hypothetical protein H6659_03895 [Ardenticatenaceae bacterium]|nr:hypothetical protein [Ardenticatenaceae bacterium]MCB8986403.1 hypothetical protein [Ardenticatenaceae bacterium]
MRNRLYISLVLIACYGVFRAVWLARYAATIQAQVALLPLPRSSVQYGLSRSMTFVDGIISLATLMVFSGLLFVWLSYVLEQRAQEPWFARG